MKRLIFFLTLTLLTTSCSDFFESEEDKALQKSSNQGGLSQTSLPVEYFESINNGTYSLEKTVGNLAYNVVAPRVNMFFANSLLFEQTLTQYCQNTDDEALESLVKQWDAMVLSFHEMATSAIGPINQDQGAFLKKMHSYPFLQKCRIDQLMITQQKTLPTRLPFNAQGLSAIEYLLFPENENSSCERPNRDMSLEMIQAWNQKSPVEKSADRCRAASLLSSELRRKAETLTAEWRSSEYPSQAVTTAQDKLAITEIAQSLIQLEVVKDLTLAGPMGLHRSCETEGPCPENIEHRLSRIALPVLHTKLKSALELYTGQQGFGIDDYLENLGHKALSDGFQESLEKAIQTSQDVVDLGLTFAELIEQTDTENCTNTDNQQPLCQLYRDVNTVGFLLKTDVLTALSLEVTLPVAGEADGL